VRPHPPSTPPDLIILDFDGVVADSELLSNTLLADYITSCGRPTSVEHAIARYMGRRWEDCERAIAEDFGAPLPSDFQERYRAFENGRMRRDVQPVPGVVTFLATYLQQRFCVASSSQLGWLEHVTDKFDLRPHLGGNLFSASAVPRGKPAPDVFLYAAEQMAVAPANCVVIEDSAAGVEGGVAAGMRVIGFLGGAHIRPGHRERLIAAGAHDVAASFPDIARLLNLRTAST
jgi:HAD superfamily hydrolase (TIGR01509 family)